MTRHAQTRMAQRSIPPIALTLLEQFGSEMRHHGADVLFMDKAARRRIADAFGGDRALRMLGPVLDSYAVLAGGSVITVGHRTKRLRRDVSRRRPR